MSQQESDPQDIAGGLLPAALMLAFVAIILLLGSFAVPFLLALIITWATGGFAASLRQLGWPAGAATAAATVLGTVTLFTLVATVSLLLVDQVAGLVQRWPELSAKGVEILQRYLTELGLEEQAQSVQAALTDPLTTVTQNAATVGSFAWSLTGPTFNTLMILLLTPFITFYFLKDGKRLLDQSARWLKPSDRGQVINFFTLSRQRLRDFLRGQLSLCAVQALFHGIGLALIGLDFGLLIGIATGAASIIPVLGNTTMFIIAMTVAILQGEGWLLPVMVAGLYGLSELLETAVLAPFLIGNRIQVHPLFIIAALLIGGSLFGLAGAILALPFAAVCSTFVAEFGPAAAQDHPLRIAR